MPLDIMDSLWRVYQHLGEPILLITSEGERLSLLAKVDRSPVDSRKNALSFDRDTIHLRLLIDEADSQLLDSVTELIIDEQLWSIDDWTRRNAYEWDVDLVRAPEAANYAD